MARKIASLPRVLGPGALFGAAYGEIGGALYFALGVTAVYALGLTPAVFLAAGFIFALAAAAYAEGGATLPEGGGAAGLARRAFNDLTGFIAGWATILDYVIVVALSAIFIPHYAAAAVGEPGAVSEAEAAALAVAIIAVVTVVRLVRRPALYAFTLIVAAADLVVQGLLALLGLAFLFSWDRLSADIELGTAPTWDSVAFALPIAMLAYTGLEKVGSLVGEARDPAKSVPAGVRSSVFAAVILHVAVALAAVSAFPIEPDPAAPAGYSSALSTTWVNAPLVGLAQAVGDEGGDVLGAILRAAVGATACAVLLVALITGFSGSARVAATMADHAQLPGLFSRRGRVTLAPPAAVGAMGVAAIGMVAIGSLFEGDETLTLAALYSFGVLIAFMLAQAALIWLRLTEPDLPRPFLMKGNVRVRGRLVPVTSVVGAATAFVAWVIALGTHEGARVVGPLWLLVGIVAYATVRVARGLPLLGRYEPAAPPPEDVTDVEYGAVVVALERDDEIGEETAAVAFRIAAESRSRVIGVTAIVIPVRDPLGADAPARMAEADRVQALADGLAAEYDVEYEGRIVRTRSAGRAIVDAAVEAGAGLVVLGSPEKRRVARTVVEEAFGETVGFVLRKSPSRVFVVHFPTPVVEASAGEPAS